MREEVIPPHLESRPIRSITASRRATERKRRTAERRQPINEAKATFDSQLDELAKVGGFSLHVSMLLNGKPTSDAGELASMVHSKMCAHARSIGAIAKSSMFDHSSIMCISRMMIEGLTMSHYLREQVDDDTWHVRYLSLQIQDISTRLKMLRISGDKNSNLREIRNNITASIKKSNIFLLLTEESQDKILEGEQMFVGVMRRAAKNSG